jgi:hypothetical protein
MLSTGRMEIFTGARKNRDLGMCNKYLVPKGSCFLARFGPFCGAGGVLILQLFHLGFVSTQIVHLPVPSENFGGRGKNFTGDRRWQASYGW